MPTGDEARLWLYGTAQRVLAGLHARASFASTVCVANQRGQGAAGSRLEMSLELLLKG